MTLFEKLQDVIPMGYKVTLSHFAFNLVIRIERVGNDDKTYSRDSWLPLSDHFYEAKVVDCSDFMIRKNCKEMDIAKAEMLNVQPKNDMQCGVGKNNI